MKIVLLSILLFSFAGSAQESDKTTTGKIVKSKN